MQLIKAYSNLQFTVIHISALPPVPPPPQVAPSVGQYQYQLPQSPYQYQPTPHQYQYQPELQQPLPPPQPRVNLPYQPPPVITDAQYQPQYQPQQLQYDPASSGYFDPSPLDKKVIKNSTIHALKCECIFGCLGVVQLS